MLLKFQKNLLHNTYIFFKLNIKQVLNILNGQKYIYYQEGVNMYVNIQSLNYTYQSSHKIDITTMEFEL